jgi:hypothetical protein
MADITASCDIKKSWNGEVLELLITTPATAATGSTIDLASDNANGIGVIMSEIKSCYAANALGAVKVATFVAATGIITLGTITTGIHVLVVKGI